MIFRGVLGRQFGKERVRRKRRRRVERNERVTE